MKVMKLGLVVGIGLFFGGCAGQGVDLNRQQMVFVEGKPFRIPKGTDNITYTFNSKKDKEALSTYRKNGLDCRVGDIMWAETSVSKKSLSIAQSGSMIAKYTYLANEAKNGKVGCVRPLSDREYDYYRQKDAENDARRYAATAQIAKNIGNSTPKTYNVNVKHSGYINQNVNMNHSGYINTYGY